MSHAQLLQKLQSIGCRGIPLQLFSSYLKERKQCVQIENKISEYEIVKYGVPQGTVLGPILFTIYINDILTQNSAGQMISFADDTAIFYSSKNWQTLKTTVEQDLKKVKTCFDSKLLTINYNKTYFLPVTSLSNNLPSYKVLDITDRNKTFQICSSEKVKYLGIYIDNHLRWNFQIQSMVQKLRGLLYKFKQLKQILNIQHLKVVYKALVESILRYGIIGWGGVGVTHIKQLEVIQKRIIKIIYNKKARYPTDLLFQESNLFNIRQIYCYTSLIQQHKFRDLSQVADHNYDTRCKIGGYIKIERKTKSIGQKYFQYVGVKLYNMLPKNIRDTLYMNRFKILIKNWIQNQGISIYESIFE